MDWRAFFDQHRSILESHYPGLTVTRFLREAQEIGGDGAAFLAGVPFAYQLGYAEFVDHKFTVTTDVLIPRPETEQLFELVDQAIKNHPAWRRLVDVGTGSGCLGLSLAHAHPMLSASLADISPEALLVAKGNARNLGLHSVTFQQSDLLKEIVGLFDVIVTNPPYIPRSAQGVHAMTERHEPHLALYVEDAQYETFFKRLFDQSARRLTSDGMFFMEGHEDRLTECAQWAKTAKLTQVQVLNDLTGRPRFLTAQAPRVPVG
jgi:release factor glutamine methyltransferase